MRTLDQPGAMEKSLADSVQALPLELIDEIYKHTLTADSNVRYMTDSWGETRSKPHSCLQVDHKTRESFAESYYGDGAIFQIEFLHAKAWIDSLEPKHAHNLREFHLIGIQFPKFPTKKRTRQGAIRLMRDLTREAGVLEWWYAHISFKWNLDFLGRETWMDLGELMAYHIREMKIEREIERMLRSG